MSTPAPAARRALADANARAPGRNKRLDGIMGDPSHQRRVSDHNDGNAVDITVDADAGIVGTEIALLAAADPRSTYVIHRGHIYNKERHAEGWRRYTGDNPHNDHVHISIAKHLRSDDSPWPWAPEARGKSWPPAHRLGRVRGRPTR